MSSWKGGVIAVGAELIFDITKRISFVPRGRLFRATLIENSMTDIDARLGLARVL